MHGATTGGYFLDYFVSVARPLDNVTLHIDLQTAQVSPDALNTTEIRAAAKHYTEWLPSLVESHGVPRIHLVGARLALHIDFASMQTRAGYFNVEYPVECTVELDDDRGKTSRGLVKKTWPVVAAT
jgi:hypothetical protein